MSTAIPSLDSVGFSPPRLSVEEARLQLSGLLSGETDLVANSANTSAFLNSLLDDINWVGFYFLHDAGSPDTQVLVLGPFQGQSACVRIPVGKGVCGVCAATGETQRVDDVHAFPGHIACDIRSRSELVVPVFNQGAVVAVLDIDSPLPARFRLEEQRYVEALVDEFATHQFS